MPFAALMTTFALTDFPTLPFRATSEQACAWLESATASPWTLARLLTEGLTPYVWFDYDAAYPELFGDANGGYAAPIFFEDDIARLVAGSDDVLITITKDAHKLVTRLEAPGFRRELHQLRFQKRDLERLAEKLHRDAQPKPVVIEGAKETRSGISRDQVLMAFAEVVKIDMVKALDGAAGVFGDEGARVKGSAKKKNAALYNPVTLALGLNDLYRVPISRLKRVFQAHDFLYAWHGHWEQTLTLLGK